MQQSIILQYGTKLSRLCLNPHKNSMMWHRSQSTLVRVRFAPSPTGFLHLGGLRTAIYNYLFARSHDAQGKFILRIEDTDQMRTLPEATRTIIDDLRWMGIEIDEGPGEIGGCFGPYIQSERISIYLSDQKHVETLLNNGMAYRCFCTERRLDLLRKEALRHRQVPKYDNKCRTLNKEDSDLLLSLGKKFCVRFKLTDYMEPWTDIIYGNIQHNVNDTEGDPIIMKSDNYPTYHFANVVDDHLMKITHVFRGVEWQISTVKHLLLYRAFGWKAPDFGHLPLLVNADGSKLSKRQGDIGINILRTKGYFPNALLNYVVSAGGGFSYQHFDKLPCYNMKELIEKFNISTLNTTPSRLSPIVLDDLNRKELKKHLESDISANKLVEYTKHIVSEKYSEITELVLDEERIKRNLQWAANRLTLIKDIITPKFEFLWVTPGNCGSLDLTKEQGEVLLMELENCKEFEKNSLGNLLRVIAQRCDLKYSFFMKSLRKCLGGIEEGPGVPDMMEILGKRIVLQRLKYGLETDKTKVT